MDRHGLRSEASFERQQSNKAFLPADIYECMNKYKHKCVNKYM